MLRSSDLCIADRATVRILARAVKAAKATEQAEKQRKALEAGPPLTPSPPRRGLHPPPRAEAPHPSA